MKLNAKDWSKLQIPLLALAAMVALGAASILFAREELDQAQVRLAKTQQLRKEIDNKLRQVRSEENEIRQKAAVSTIYIRSAFLAKSSDWNGSNCSKRFAPGIACLKCTTRSPRARRWKRHRPANWHFTPAQ